MAVHDIQNGHSLEIRADGVHTDTLEHCELVNGTLPPI